MIKFLKVSDRLVVELPLLGRAGIIIERDSFQSPFINGFECDVAKNCKRSDLNDT